MSKHESLVKLNLRPEIKKEKFYLKRIFICILSSNTWGLALYME